MISYVIFYVEEYQGNESVKYKKGTNVCLSEEAIVLGNKILQFFGLVQSKICSMYSQLSTSLFDLRYGTRILGDKTKHTLVGNQGNGKNKMIYIPSMQRNQQIHGLADSKECKPVKLKVLVTVEHILIDKVRNNTK